MHNDDNDAFLLFGAIYLTWCDNCKTMVRIANHTDEHCERLRRIMEDFWPPLKRTEVPSAFYKAFEGEVNDE